MTTPDTSAVRAWARDNGLAVAERGRLPAEVHAAYAAANGKPRKAPAKQARPPKAAKPARTPRPVVDDPGPATAVLSVPAVDEARVAALEAQVADLAARLAKLEQPAPAAPAKPPRFRRRG